MATDGDTRGPSDPDNMGVYFAPKEFRYTTVARDVTEGDDITCVICMFQIVHTVPNNSLLSGAQRGLTYT